MLLLLVILFHVHLVAIGWTSILGFFVLSGFLITRVLLKDREAAPTPSSYFKRFYARRALRIFPVYYFYLAVIALGMALVPKLSDAGSHLPYALAYLYNFFVASGQGEHSRLFAHLWSLSAEEQFYFVWPWLVLLTPRQLLGRVVLFVAACGPLMRAGVASLLPLDAPVPVHIPTANAIYVLTTSHIDAFALGAAINFVRYRPKAWHFWLLIGTALAAGMLVNGFGVGPRSHGGTPLILGWPLWMPQGFQYVWGYTLLNLLWFMLIAGIVQGGALKRVFSTAVLDYLGKRSYAAYLVHFPLLALMEPLWRGVQGIAGVYLGSLLFLVPYLFAVIACASLCRRWIELPMLRLKERYSSGQAPAPGAPALVKVTMSRT